MDVPRYQKQLRPEPLNARRKLYRSWQSIPWLVRVLLVTSAGALVLLAGSHFFTPRKPVREHAPPPASPGLVTQLAGTRVETARAKLDQGRADEALVLAVAALEADPAREDARSLTEMILARTVWQLPVLELAHPMPIERIECAAPSSLWVSLAGDNNTTVRWNLDTLRIENVLFPLPAAQTRSLVADPTGRRMVVERAGILLLCDARTLKPVKDLGALPEFVTPSAVIVFSADGLLMAHPALVSESAHPLVWHLRDAASGEILRTWEPAEPEAAKPLTAFLNRRELRILQADGGTWKIPVTPMEPARFTAAADPVSLLHAQFGADGSSAFVLVDRGPHQAPEPASWPEGNAPEPAVLLERFSWNRQPGIWNGLLREHPQSPLTVDGNVLLLRNGAHAPIYATSSITAVAAAGMLRYVGQENGMLTIHQLLPVPEFVSRNLVPEAAGKKSIAALSELTEALAGIRQEEKSHALVRIDAAERIRIFGKCDFSAIRRLFPQLDFGALIEAFHGISLRKQPSDALHELTGRLARADPQNPNAASSPAARLAQALDSTWPAWIADCLNTSGGMPPLLRKLALSRIAWLEGRKADALAGWPDVFPDLAKVRMREDWDGWEQEDFSQALEKLRLCVTEELAAVQLPENPTPEQRKSVIKRLLDADTLRSIGPARLARASLNVAVALADSQEEAESIIMLADRARNLGEAPEPCLRVEARGFGMMGDYQKARDRWVLLLTEHPVERHEPSDYSEAAYTAFECADPGQAMEILTTGLHRFPADSNFALRAGWIALLTGSPERAYRFLTAGRESGFAPEKLEYATALFVVAASQTGLIDDAAVYRNDLLHLNPAWGEAATIEALDWPEELKAALFPPVR